MAENITYAEMKLTTGKGKGQDKTDTVRLQEENLGVTYAAVKRLPKNKKEKSSKSHTVLASPQHEDDGITYAAVTQKANQKTHLKDSDREDSVTYAALRGTRKEESEEHGGAEDDQCEVKTTWDTGVTVAAVQRFFQGRRSSMILVSSLAALCLVLAVTTFIGISYCAGNATMFRKGFGLSSATDSSPCPDPWILITNKCYLFSDNRKSHKDSENDCEGRNAKLATVKEGTILKLVTITKQEFWIGLKSLGSQHHGNWSGKWEDGSTVIITEGQGTCAKISNGRLILHNCQQDLPWICEKELL